MKLEEQFFKQDELFEITDSFDTYQEDYAQELLDDDALNVQEAAFLKGYSNWQQYKPKENE